MQSSRLSNGSQKMLREGDAVLLKVSGDELEGKGLSGLMSYIGYLQRRKLRTVLVYGGGMQIDRVHEKKFQTQRRRVQGITAADATVREAYLKIQRHLSEWIPAIRFSDSLVIRAEENTVDVSDASLQQEHDSVTAFGFIGTNGTMNFNLNADSVACALIRKFHAIQRAIFYTNVGCIYGKKKRRIPVMRAQDIREDGSHAFVETSEGIRPKLLASKDCGLSEILITSAEKLRETTEMWAMQKEGGTIVRNVP